MEICSRSDTSPLPWHATARYCSIFRGEVWADQKNTEFPLRFFSHDRKAVALALVTAFAISNSNTQPPTHTQEWITNWGWRKDEINDVNKGIHCVLCTCFASGYTMRTCSHVRYCLEENEYVICAAWASHYMRLGNKFSTFISSNFNNWASHCLSEKARACQRDGAVSGMWRWGRLVSKWDGGCGFHFDHKIDSWYFASAVWLLKKECVKSNWCCTLKCFTFKSTFHGRSPVFYKICAFIHAEAGGNPPIRRTHAPGNTVARRARSHV